MILQALAKYYENLAEEEKVARPGWCSAKVSYQSPGKIFFIIEIIIV